ncbi:MAG: heme-binding domain-containing protein [Lentimicrobiaceae bacterium]|nr:heme-binding domain-containing protein [Lentimicrobiaceae bacterium]
MKNYLKIVLFFVIVVVLMSWKFPETFISPKYDAAIQITTMPDSVALIVEKSCYPCHSNKASGLSASLLNFEKFSALKPNKKAKKLDAICDEISRGKMPPAGFISKNPGLKLSGSDIQKICSWTKSEKDVTP